MIARAMAYLDMASLDRAHGGPQKTPSPALLRKGGEGSSAAADGSSIARGAGRAPSPSPLAGEGRGGGLRGATQAKTGSAAGHSV